MPIFLAFLLTAVLVAAKLTFVAAMPWIVALSPLLFIAAAYVVGAVAWCVVFLLAFLVAVLAGAVRSR